MRLLPLGGLGEFGLNAMLFEAGGERLLVDCGLMFGPADGGGGGDVYLPDLSYVRADPARLKAVLVTHGHEDHLGALPSLLFDVAVPVYGTAYTLALLRHKLDEAGVRADLRELSPRAPLRLSEVFQVEAFQVAHSTPQAVGLVVRGGGRTVVHTGDFKLDSSPTDGRTTDLERLASLGDEGVDCLLSDSTNAEHEGESGSEATVAAALSRIVSQAPGRVVVVLFSSHLSRVAVLLRLAQQLGRRAAVLGRSLLRNIELGQQAGCLEVPPGVLLPPGAPLSSVPPERLLVLATGAQAEARSAVQALLAPGAPDRIGPADTVVWSARIIPGNERAVGAVLDQLVLAGARVHYPRLEPSVHVSGHAARAEQRRVLELVRPRGFVPVHGELRHLWAHGQLARETGVPAEAVCLARDGDVISLASGRPELLGRAAFGRVVRESDGEASRPGAVVVVSTVIERGSLRILVPPVLQGLGLTAEMAGVLPYVTHEVRSALTELSAALRSDDALVKERLAEAVRQGFRRRAMPRPAVLAQVLRP